jgi:aubergine-like protein
LTKVPIPSQVVLVSTIKAGKNLRSIINKILIQICAKVGGTPWAVLDMPFTEKPTMIMGIDIIHKASMKNQTLVAVCATCNRHFSRYWSTAQIHEDGHDITTGIQNEAKKALLSFFSTNKTFPQRVVVYRDGISDSQRKVVKEIEVNAILRAFEELKSAGLTKAPEFYFVAVNKKMNAKFFSSRDNLDRETTNPDQGTVIDTDITTGRDFYLIS